MENAFSALFNQFNNVLALCLSDVVDSINYSFTADKLNEKLNANISYEETFLDIMTGDNPINGYYQCCLLGDVDKDGEISVIDAIQIQKYAAGKTDLQDDDLFLEYSYRVYGPNVKYRSDFNRDGERDIIDATAIQRFAVSE